MKIACLLAAGLALASSAAVVRADIDPVQNDVKALNYALQLEHLEAAFYTKGLSQFQSSDFPTGVADYLQLIKAHEQAHVSILSGAISTPVAQGGYGSTAGAACSSYVWSNTEGNNFPDVNTFLSTAITLEDIGVSAYVAALNHLTNTDVQQVAATIATIEARHAAYLRNAVGSATASPATNVPFPEAVNTARLPAQVLPLASPFLGTCSYNLSANVPTVRPAGVAIPATGGTTPSAAVPSSATQVSPAPTYSQTQFDADIAVLQYALTLEYLEADFYQTFQNRFTADQFGAVSTIGSNTGTSIAANIDLIRAHEVAHVQALQSIIRSRGVAPRTPGCYNWTSITSAQTFLAVAAKLENTGVSAYDGAANGLTDTGLQQVAASVAVVEARHAAYLNVITGKNATNQEYMNGNRDLPQTSDQIVSAVQGLSPYITGAIFNCANNAANQGSSGSFGPASSTGTTNPSSSTGTRNPSSSSSSSSTGNNGNDPGAASIAVPAFASAALAFVAALLF